MSDSIELRAGGLKVQDFKGYAINSSLYTAGDAFTLDLSQTTAAVGAGMRCELYVNDALELTGLIDKATLSNDKTASSLRVEGRDLTGLLLDSCVESFIDLENVSLKGLASLLLKKAPFINRKKIIFGKGHAVDYSDSDATPPKLEPGETIFEALRKFALARGLLFFSYPDGTLVFGKPLSKGAPEFTLVRRAGRGDSRIAPTGGGNNVLSGEKVEDFTKRFSKITVLGQQDGGDAEDVNVVATLYDKTFPFYKPLVLSMNHDGDSPGRFAKLTRDRMRSEGFQLHYEVAGYSQDGKNWGVNRLCRIEDEILGVSGVFLIYARTFELSKTKGRTTKLQLGYPGVL